jgi:hypothetical protein
LKIGISALAADYVSSGIDQRSRNGADLAWHTRFKVAFREQRWPTRWLKLPPTWKPDACLEAGGTTATGCGCCASRIWTSAGSSVLRRSRRKQRSSRGTRATVAWTLRAVQAVVLPVRARRG